MILACNEYTFTLLYSTNEKKDTFGLNEKNKESGKKCKCIIYLSFNYLVDLETMLLTIGRNKFVFWL